MIQILSIALLGALLGHGVRRSVPFLLGLKDRSLPWSIPWLEIAGAILFTSTAWRLGPEASFWPFLFVLFLLAITACDYFVKLIPDLLSFGAGLLGVVWSAFDPRLLFDLPAQRWLLLQFLPELQGQRLEGIALSLSGAMLGFLALETIRRFFGLLAGLEVMGLGDSKLALALGATLGPVGILMCLPVAFIIGVAHGAVFLGLTGQPHSAFGPPLALAGYLTLLLRGDLGTAIGAFQRLILSLPLPVLAGLYSFLIAVAIFLIWRTRQKARDYEAMIEEDYRQVEERLQD